MNIYQVAERQCCANPGESTARIVYGSTLNVNFNSNTEPEPNKPVRERRMQNHDVQLSPERGNKYSFVDGYHYLVTPAGRRQPRVVTELGYSKDKTASMRGIGEPAHHNRCGVFYQRANSEKHKRIRSDLTELHQMLGFQGMQWGGDSGQDAIWASSGAQASTVEVKGPQNPPAPPVVAPVIKQAERLAEDMELLDQQQDGRAELIGGPTRRGRVGSGQPQLSTFLQSDANLIQRIFQ